MTNDARPGLEIEIRLAGAPAALAAAFRSLGGRAGEAVRTHGAYHDTADERLRRRGFALRLRTTDKGRELTLKRESGGGVRRGEWSAPVPGPAVDLALLPPAAPRAEVEDIPPEALGLRFETHIMRRGKRIAIPGATLEAVLDEGRIAAGGAECAVAELELELLDGSAAALLRRARALCGEHALRVETRSKSARGRQLAAGSPPPTPRAARPALRETDRLADAFAAIIGNIASHVAANVAAAADGRDPEGVHQLRVGLRRLRSLLALPGARLPPAARAVGEEAKRALRALGPARDIDVFIAETLPPVLESVPEAPGLARLAERAGARAGEARGGVRRTLGGRRFNLFLIDLLRLAEGDPPPEDAETPVGALAGPLLRRRHRRALKAGRGFEQLSNSRRHQARIALKKLRYACGFFQTLYPADAARPWLVAMSDLQDTLGRLNDSAVAASVAADIAGGDSQAAIGAAIVKGWYAHRLRAEEPRMVAAWRRFAAMRPFWPV